MPPRWSHLHVPRSPFSYNFFPSSISQPFFCPVFSLSRFRRYHSWSFLHSMSPTAHIQGKAVRPPCLIEGTRAEALVDSSAKGVFGLLTEMLSVVFREVLLAFLRSAWGKRFFIIPMLQRLIFGRGHLCKAGNERRASELARELDENLGNAIFEELLISASEATSEGLRNWRGNLTRISAAQLSRRFFYSAAGNRRRNL